jgi:hypothetical protein
MWLYALDEFNGHPHSCLSDSPTNRSGQGPRGRHDGTTDSEYHDPRRNHVQPFQC